MEYGFEVARDKIEQLIVILRSMKLKTRLVFLDAENSIEICRGTTLVKKTDRETLSVSSNNPVVPYEQGSGKKPLRSEPDKHLDL